MKRVLLTLIATFLLCLTSFAQDLNFSAFKQGPSVITNFSTIQFEYSMSYNDAVDLAKKTGKIIVVTKDVDNDKEIAAQCEKDGNLYVNADGDPDFHVGLSKLEYIGGKILYIELPSSAFPDRQQGVQYRINRDEERARAKVAQVRPGKVLVPQTVVDINLNKPVTNAPRYYNMDGTPYIGNGVFMGNDSCGPGG